MKSLLDYPQLDIHILSIQCKKAFAGHFRNPTRAHYEMVYKIDGRSRQFFDGLTLDLVPDSIYIIPKNKINTYTVTEPGNIVDVLFEVYGDIKEDTDPEIILLQADNRYKSRFLSAAGIWGSGEPSSYCSCQAIVNGILADLICERRKKYMQSSRYSYILPALDYIRENFRNKIHISDLTGISGISGEYLRILFREYTGHSPYEYINDMRMSYARELLLNGNIGVAGAAAESGFENVNYFSRLFRKKYHIPPSRVNTVEFIDPKMENIYD